MPPESPTQSAVLARSAAAPLCVRVRWSARLVMSPFRMLICIASASAYSLTGSPAVAARRTIRMMADVTVKFPGGRSATVPVGSPLSLAAYQAGCQVTYQCKAGTCASCEVLNGMQPVRCCQYKVKKPLLGSTISISSKPGSATRL